MVYIRFTLCIMTKHFSELWYEVFLVMVFGLPTMTKWHLFSFLFLTALGHVCENNPKIQIVKSLQSVAFSNYKIDNFWTNI